MARPETHLGGIVIRDEQMDADISVALGTSLMLDVSRCSKVGFEIRADDGTHVGTIYFRVVNALTHTPIALAIPSVAVETGVAINDYVEIVDLCAKYLEVFYDRTSGDGKLSVFAHLKNECYMGGS